MRSIAALILVACSSTTPMEGGDDASTDTTSDVGMDAKMDSSNPDANTLDANEASTDSGCAMTVCNGQCVDTISDDKNCGKCGHDCLGGTCTAGRCDPVVLLANTRVADFVLGANDVYIVLEGQNNVGKCAKTGCNKTPTLLSAQSGQFDTRRITTDQQTLYWTSLFATSVYACPVSGCVSPATFTATSLYGAGITTDGTNIFWVTSGTAHACPINNCGQPTDLGGADWGIATDKTNVYFVQNGDLVKCPVTGCNSPTFMFSGLQPRNVLTTDGVNVYVGEWYGSGSVYQCSVNGCNGTPTVLYTSQGNGFGAIATDGTDVYFPDDKKVVRCAVGGCNQQPTVMGSTSINAVGSIAVDATKVFFTDPSLGQTMYYVAK